MIIEDLVKRDFKIYNFYKLKKGTFYIYFWNKTIKAIFSLFILKITK